MIIRGTISTVDNTLKKARIIFAELDSTVSAEIPIALDVGMLNVGDNVAAVFFSNMADGLIIARY